MHIYLILAHVPVWYPVSSKAEVVMLCGISTRTATPPGTVVARPLRPSTGCGAATEGSREAKRAAAFAAPVATPGAQDASSAPILESRGPAPRRPAASARGRRQGTAGASDTL